MTPDDRTPDDRTPDEFASAEERLRATLHHVAESAAPTDGLDRLRAAVDASRTADRSVGATASSGATTPAAEPVVLALHPARSDRSAWLRGIAAVAAAVLVVVGLGAVVVSQRGSGDKGADMASGGTRADAGSEAATGWYVPVDLPDTWALLEVRHQPLSVRPEAYVIATFRSPTGREASMVLGPSVPGPVEDDPAAFDGPGSSGFLAGMATPPAVRAVDAPGRCSSLVGHWPGSRLLVDITCVPPSDDAPTGTTTTSSAAEDTAPLPEGIDEVSELVGSLRPASATEWAAFVRGAEAYDDEVLLATVEDLRSQPPTVTAPTAPDTTGTTRPNDPEQPGPGTDPADSRTTIEDAWEFPEQFDRLDGLTFALVVDQNPVGAGQAVGARLQITNTTSEDRTIHECSAIMTGIAFVPADAPSTAVPVPQIIDCYQTPMVEIPAGETADLAFAADGYLAPLSARRIGEQGGFARPLGALEPGDYLATAVLPGSDRTVRVQVPVTITQPACDGFTDDLVRAVVGKAEAEARAAAQQLSFELRPMVIDGLGQVITDDIRCDRVNVIVSGGRVIDVVGVN